MRPFFSAFCGLTGHGHFTLLTSNLANEVVFVYANQVEFIPSTRCEFFPRHQFAISGLTAVISVTLDLGLWLSAFILTHRRLNQRLTPPHRSTACLSACVSPLRPRPLTGFLCRKRLDTQPAPSPILNLATRADGFFSTRTMLDRSPAPSAPRYNAGRCKCPTRPRAPEITHGGCYQGLQKPSRKTEAEPPYSLEWGEQVRRTRQQPRPIILLTMYQTRRPSASQRSLAPAECIRCDVSSPGRGLTDLSPVSPTPRNQKTRIEPAHSVPAAS